ncbi:MAG: hypothetical protein JRG80_05345 [Deltaproteobacteria bacterium]|nr:hypothetical protein [Deltaproteobacteria bacterium]MBW2398681.1 hypothetical protein [Deltaproteobacteria bacterium]
MDHQNEYHDWMRSEGEYSDDMRYWFEMEGLTYAMKTPRGQKAMLREAGFGERAADHFVENWRATVVVCEKGEMLQVYSRARASARAEKM